MRYHLAAVIDTVRHGQKDAEGLLTLEGHMQAALKAVSLDKLAGTVKLYHSGAPRVYKTVRMIRDLLTKTTGDLLHDSFGTDVQACIDQCSLDEDIPGVVRPELHFLYDQTQKGTYFSTWSDAPTPEEADARAQAFLNFHGNSPEPGIIPSPKEMAQRVSRLLLEQLEDAINTEITRDNYINGTHEPVLLAFLGYALSGFTDPAPDFVASIGGAIDFVEGFQVKLYHNPTWQTYTLDILFRDQKIVCTMEDVRTFIQA